MRNEAAETGSRMLMRINVRAPPLQAKNKGHKCAQWINTPSISAEFWLYEAVTWCELFKRVKAPWVLEHHWSRWSSLCNKASAMRCSLFSVPRCIITGFTWGFHRYIQYPTRTQSTVPYDTDLCTNLTFVLMLCQIYSQMYKSLLSRSYF
jgi:hypothetical protein